MQDYDIDKKKLLVRMHRIQGQINAINTMIEKDAKCEDILMQLSAVTAALHALAVVTAREHVHKQMHLVAQNGTDDEVEVAVNDVYNIIDRLLRYEKA
ncbi:metal-sensing transcriptional repressor [Bifidobacteriaceae bacterium NR002]|nr:metal-sensing transcriptional repressor [Bifidobacteriaceae bacterium NR002]MDZ7549268.1 metal-sensitive transcriptional regulator [Bifidobacteriaceae bacterium NR047]